MKDDQVINVIAYQEGDVWIAQGIEFDIVARANSPDAVPAAFSKAFAKTAAISHQLYGAPFTGVGRAPARFKGMFDNAQAQLVPVGLLDYGVEDTHVDIRLAAAA